MKRLLQGLTRAINRFTGRSSEPADQNPAARPTRQPAKKAAKKQAAQKQAAKKQAAKKVAVPKPRPPRRRRAHYAPELDGRADPGEVVWTWVPYEDNPSQGKDRPVVIIGRDGEIVLGLMLSSQAERDGQRHWLALGAGAWDRQDRPSWVRLDRVLRMPEDSIRREGAILDRARFDRIAAALRREYGWH